VGVVGIIQAIFFQELDGYVIGYLQSEFNYRVNLEEAKSLVAQWHCLLSFMRRTRVRIPLPIVVTIELSKI
jgi:hypothetical protein